jgi:uncharacterized membrane protein
LTISEIKKTAKTRLTGKYIKCASASLLYFLVAIVFAVIQEFCYEKISNAIVFTVLQAIFSIISLILAYGIISNIIDLADEKTKSITDFLNKSIVNAVKYIKILARIIIRLAIPIILEGITLYNVFGNAIAKQKNISFLCFAPEYYGLSIVLFVIMSIIFICIGLNYALVPYIYHASSDSSSKEIVEKSKELIKGKKLRFILLLLSFFIWILLAAIVIYILTRIILPEYLTPLIIVFYSALKPYVTVSISEFYESLK